MSWIDIKQVDELIAELEINISNETNPVELFDSIKQLIVAAINSIDKKESTEDVSREIMRQINLR